MNRLFLLFYCTIFIGKLISFLWTRKRMPGKQQAVLFTLYGLTIFLFVILQFQQTQLLPVGHLLNILSPHIKMWVDQLL
ncbi:hypothetical protein EDM59_02575 [Brevibacillus nitrificans]|jgi:hypothetical protein|uniref:Uncharacterized protein n=1 Tax=Brevibacillus nitrificans TaxID=651560 RepID=A0A3M8DKL3_9BACL|nr:hypothetical protein [Brevibacillus nitrificans]RNB88031.1 hypothetical protein EDM59_02575 [Brevibacillus nitrificans]